METLEKELTFETLTNDLQQFYGTESWYRVSPFSQLLITDGVNHFAKTCECYWLFSDFMTQLYRVNGQNDIYFACITVEVTKTHMVKMSATEDKGMPVYWHKQQKDYGKCIPVGTYKFWIEGSVILLPNEH